MIRVHWHIFAGAGVVLLLLSSAARAGDAAPADPAAIEFFEKSVRPVLAEQCYRCHSNKVTRPKGKLRVDSREALLGGGESGPAILPGDPEKSLLLRAIRYTDPDLQMPPKKRLSTEQVTAIETWIKLGAPYPQSAAPATAPAGAIADQAPPALHGMSIEDGRAFWSFKPPVDPDVPQASDPAHWAHNSIDRFILAKLQAKSLSPSPIADKRTLIRRATYDLTGLPPTIEEVRAFEADASSDAYEKVIDRLLASPRYGERWGRYWLDVARYADTKGYVFQEERRYAFSYTYRDWVIRAFNEDLPYDQFLIQQIAADRLDLKDDKRPLAALGFLTLGRRFLNNPPDIIDDRIDVVTRGTMGLTVSCARCHDHKYDPIPQADYYSLYGVFASSTEPKDLPLIEPAGAAEANSPERKAFEAELAKKTSDLAAERQKSLDAHMASLRSAPQVAQYLITASEADHNPPEKLPELFQKRTVNGWMLSRWRAYLAESSKKDEAVFRAWRLYAARLAAPNPVERLSSPLAGARLMREQQGGYAALAIAVACLPPRSVEQVAHRYARVLSEHDRADAFADAGDEAIRQVLRGAGSPTLIAPADARQVFTVDDNNRINGIQQQIDALVATHPGSPPRAMAMEALPRPVEPHIFRRGNPNNPGDAVPRQFLAVLSPPDRKPFADDGRLELAKLIASPDNPLTSRVIVNRVWLHHFGQGLVRTPSDFGTRGERPTHPELLEFLARRFVLEDGWSIKKLHKRIMLSAAYQQASLDNPAARQADPENRLLWRQNPQRLDFEALRDSLLAAAGRLDLTPGGRPVDILSQPFTTRRTVYAFIDRQNLPGLFRTFDFASPDSTSPQRFSTSVPQQALFMMNSPFVLEQARKLAARPEVSAESDPPRRIAQLYRTVLSREPTAEEIALATRFIESESHRPAETIEPKPVYWQYGYGEVDDAAQALKSFTPLPHFDGSAWQGGAARPDAKLGWVMLTATGGHAGNDLHHAAVRRWVAPRDCTISVSGTLSHAQKDGDGVRGRIFTPGDGQLASWLVHRRQARTDVSGIDLKKGQAIDFVVDCGRAQDVNFDSFDWQVVITKAPAAEAVAGDDAGGTWNSAAQFAGPAPAPQEPLSPWEKYAQVLLESNEFAFVD